MKSIPNSSFGKIHKRFIHHRKKSCIKNKLQEFPLKVENIENQFDTKNEETVPLQSPNKTMGNEINNKTIVNTKPTNNLFSKIQNKIKVKKRISKRAFSRIENRILMLKKQKYFYNIPYLIEIYNINE